MGPPPGPGGEQVPGKPPEEEKKDEVKDGVRMRGGFSVNGGVMLLPNSGPSPAFGFAGRLGVQINHYFGIVYQNTPIVTLTVHGGSSGMDLSSSASAGLKAGFADYNSLMLMVTLFHLIDIGAGPSLDFLAVANEGESISAGGVVTTNNSSSGIWPGAHGRFAFNIGGLSGNGPRRSGFAIGVDAHPIFTGPGSGLSLTAGLGAEWY
jgi:hypothetical protein